MFVLRQLQALTHLDLSDDPAPEEEADGGPSSSWCAPLAGFSRQKSLCAAAVGAFVEMRSGLVFMGLLDPGPAPVFSSAQR